MTIFTRKSSISSRAALCRTFSVLVLLLCTTVFLLAQETRPDQSATSLKPLDILRKFPITKFYDAPLPLPQAKPGDLIRSMPFDRYALSSGLAVRILYYSRSASGDLVAATGVVLTPDGKPPAGGWPMIAWAHKLSGVARPCAPTLARNLLYGPFLSMYVNLGYAVVATDYTGLGTSFRNAFADVQSNAFDVIFSIPSARSAVPELGPRWIAMGTGEGAMAAVGVAELEHEISDPTFLGSIAISQLTDLDDLLEPRGNQSHELPLLLAYGVKTIYRRFAVRNILTDPAMQLYQQVGEACSVPEAEKIPVARLLKTHWEMTRSSKTISSGTGSGRRPQMSLC